MSKYNTVVFADFLERENRFIAKCSLNEEEKEVVVHVKNTGRCKELLDKGVKVALSYQPSPTRKTDYDLIAVKKREQWINIDSQIPNELAMEAIKSSKITFSSIKGELTKIKREVTFGSSRFDIYFETNQEEKVIVEVKGMTLENNQIGAFPDAPTSRGLKHVKELIALREQGYHVFLLFIIQLEQVNVATINEEMQPELQKTIQEGMAKGLEVVAYNCQVTPSTIEVKSEVPFQINQEFQNPNR